MSVGHLPPSDAICPQAASGSCPAPSPCACHNGVIYCERRNLTCVPDILPKPGNFHSLNMRHNIITTIPNSAFSALNITTLFLEHNNISSINDFAFKGLETLRNLYLQHNRLKVLPVALKYFLINLKVLDVSFNPIDGEKSLSNNSIVEGFSNDVATEIGKSVTNFAFGDQGCLLNWPRTLYHFQQLKYLRLFGLDKVIRYIPPSSFKGFEDTLETLWIENTHLLQIPHDIGELTRLKELYIRHNEILHGDDIIVKTIFQGIGDTLETLALEYDNLTKSPEIFQYLVNLKNLSLEGNEIVYMSDEVIQSLNNGKLLFLNLKHCGLNRIPGAISDLSSLEELYISENNISTIERKDLTNLQNLKLVSFRGNPIRYISRTAFFWLPSLKVLDLSNTLTTKIPEVIQNLNSLQTLDFTNAQIDCICDIYWVKRWIYLFGMEIYIKGECETIDYPIQSYINSRIPECRQYKESIFG